MSVTDSQAPSANEASNVPFAPYTLFPKAEAFLEQHLGQSAKNFLPGPWRDRYVRYIPWLALVLLPIELFTVLACLGFTALALLLGESFVLSALLALAALACDAIALPGLFKRTRRGWAYFLYADVLFAMESLFDLSLFGVVLAAVLLWQMFQVKYRYH